MEAYNLVGIDGNAYSIMGYVTRAMKDAYEEASTPDEDGMVNEVATREFGKDAQGAYIERVKSGDYNHLLFVSMEMIDKVNKFFQDEGFELEYEDDFDEEDDDEGDW